jgi:DNA-damage-inducible protein J
MEANIMTTTMNFRVDDQVKQDFDEFATNIGTTSSSLLSMFVTRVVRDREVPFKLSDASSESDEIHLTDEQRRDFAKEILSYYDLSKVEEIPITEDGYIDVDKITNPETLDWAING